jgi:hypothetical protein
MIKIILSHITADYIPLSDGLWLQVLPSMAYLPGCQKHHFGAFIRDQRLLVVWDDQPNNLLERAESFQSSLIKNIWHDEVNTDESMSKKKEITDISATDFGYGEITTGELEKASVVQNRPTLLINSIIVGLTLALLLAALGSGWRNLAQEISIDGSFIRLALLAALPAELFVSLVSYFYLKRFFTKNYSSSCKLSL